LLSRASDLNIPGKGLEFLAVTLHYRNGHVTGLAGLDVSDGAGFPLMGAANDHAVNAIPEFALQIGCHLLTPSKAIIA
jgi:hypothetical protein